VVVVILPLPADIPQPKADSNRVAILKEQTAAWLSQQPAGAVRPPLFAESDQSLNEELDAILNEIRTQASYMSTSEIATDISQALIEAQLLASDEQAHLEAELNALLRA
jgi:hypothetical protein